MYFSDIVKLRKITSGVDTDGYPVETVTKNTVWANVKSITRSEFYSANAVDINLTHTFEIHTEDYGGETEVEYQEKVFDVVRTFQKGLGTVELVCSDKANG